MSKVNKLAVVVCAGVLSSAVFAGPGSTAGANASMVPVPAASHSATAPAPTAKKAHVPVKAAHHVPRPARSVHGHGAPAPTSK